MKKSICAVLAALLLLFMVGCNSSVKNPESETPKEDVAVVTDPSTLDNDAADKNESENSGEKVEEVEDSEGIETQEAEQKPELSEEEKHAALMEKIDGRKEICKTLNDMNNDMDLGTTYSCFYDENTNTFTYNLEVSGGSDLPPVSSFNSLIDSVDFSASSNHEYLEIDCYSNLFDGTMVLYSSLNGQKNNDLTLAKLSPDEDEPTLGEQNALKSAQEYLSFSSFSHSGLIQQLEFEGYSHAEATYGADRCGANWFEQAEKCAADYLSVSAFSESGLRDQLKFEGFTDTQAYYGAAKNGYGILLDG